MDILAILFLIFGWIFSIKGLVIAALVLSSVVTVFAILKMAFTNPEPKKKLSNEMILILDIILFGLSIIKLCIW